MINTGFTYTKMFIITVVVYLLTAVGVILFLCAWLIYVFYTLVRYMSFKRIQSPFNWLNEPLNYIGNLK